MLLQPISLLILHLLVLRVSSAPTNCTSLTSLTLPDVTITDAYQLDAGTTFSTSVDPTCFQPTYSNSVAICRVLGEVTTSPTSSVKFEMWLPDTWYRRVLTVGNGGLAGCIEYSNLDHGAALNFATIATNGGHDGTFDPSPFLMPARVEPLTDFSHRAVHVATVLGKQIASIYYGASHRHSYYNGCSTGGRQGISVASRYPNDFDGVLVGAPAVDFNHLVGAAGLWATYVATNTSRAIPPPLWTIITTEILDQCDGLDGRMDGIIADPSLCSWNPDTLLCGPEDDGTTCLTLDQIDGLKKIYHPILGTNGDVIFPAYDAGAEGDVPQPPLPFIGDGVIPMPTVIWYNYAIYGDPMRPFDGFSVSDIEYADTVDPVGISTWSNTANGLGEFKDKGGKILSYHGTRDPVIPSGLSKRFHGLLSEKVPASELYDSTDDYYRLFTVPGMGHCLGGPGAWRIGQGILAGTFTNTLNQTDHNVLLSLVDWVERRRAPSVIIGTDVQGQERKHCLWPASKSAWDGTKWECVAA